MPAVKVDPTLVAHSMSEYGVALVIVSFVLLLLFVYFWKMINQKSIIERMFDAQNAVMETQTKKIEKIKEDVLVIRIRLEGDFRVKGVDIDE